MTKKQKTTVQNSMKKKKTTARNSMNGPDGPDGQDDKKQKKHTAPDSEIKLSSYREIVVFSKTYN